MSARPLSFYLAFTVAILITSVSGTLARADLKSECLRLIDDVTNIKTNVRSTLKKTSAWADLVSRLEEGIGAHERQPFVISYLESPGTFRSYAPSVAEIERIRLNVGTKPIGGVPVGGRIVEVANFGYELNDELRRIGPIEYLVIDSKGRIVEIGTKTKLLMGAFKRHLYGAEFTPAVSHRIGELNRKLFAALRSDPLMKTKLDAFAASRKLPPGVIDEYRLAYFHPDLFSLKKWASENGYTMADLIEAGWYRMDLSVDGEPRYLMASLESIKIPFLPADGTGAIPVWRSRNLAKDKPKLPKYIGWQVDRAMNRRFTVPERLYNGGKLKSVKGKTIIITEGEFKCMVTEKMTGIPTFGIPGITAFDDELIQSLVDAEAAEYVVILDRDPHGKALLRADEVTDSNRAAYTFARDLERLGAKKVRIGILPEMKSGEKLGIDDLAIQYGVEPIFKTVREALPAETYAASVKLNPEFQDLLIRRSRLRKAVKIATIRKGRTGIAPPSVFLADAENAISRLNLTYSEYLEHDLNGARTIGMASGNANSIRPLGIRDAVPAGRTITLRSGEAVEMDAFKSDILLFDYLPSDLDIAQCRPLRCGQVPFSKQELFSALKTGTATGDLQEAMKVARTIADEMKVEPTSLEAFANVVLAAHLTHDFPLDEFRFEFDVKVASDWARTTLPVTVIRRKSGRAVAIANLHIPEGTDYWKANGTTFEKTLEILRKR